MVFLLAREIETINDCYLEKWLAVFALNALA